MPDVAALEDLRPPRRQVRLSPRVFSPDGKDHGVAGLLTCASWLLQRLPGLVVEEQRGALVEALAEAQPLIIEISPTVADDVAAAAADIDARSDGRPVADAVGVAEQQVPSAAAGQLLDRIGQLPV